MTETLSFVRADDGCMLAARELRASDAARPPVLFIHALAMNGSMWARVAQDSGLDARMVAMDCRGHGRSGKPGGPYTSERFGHDIGCVLDELNIERAVLVGCSMGGTVALGFAGRHPERVAGLALVDSTAWYGAEAPANWEARAAKAEHEGLASLVDFQLDRWFTPGFRKDHPDIANEAVRVFLANDPVAYAAACRMLGSADERGVAARYAGPAVVAVGEEDYATPLAMSQDAAGRLPGARLVVISNARHYTPLEQPLAIAECLGELLSHDEKHGAQE